MTRADGVEFGFTDHDMDLDFDGLTFRAGTGLTARALEQTSGLGVDNSEAIGAFSDKAITDQDIAAGSYDNAQVTAWIVNWSDFTQQHIIFEGTIGDIRRTGGAFEAELLGLTRQLNKPNGRVFQKACSAVLGDAKCQVICLYNNILSMRLWSRMQRARAFNYPARADLPIAGLRTGYSRF